MFFFFNQNSLSFFVVAVVVVSPFLQEGPKFCCVTFVTSFTSEVKRNACFTRIKFDLGNDWDVNFLHFLLL